MDDGCRNRGVDVFCEGVGPGKDKPSNGAREFRRLMKLEDALPAADGYG